MQTRAQIDRRGHKMLSSASPADGTRVAQEPIMTLTTLQARTANFSIAGHNVAVADVLGNLREAEINDGAGFPWFNCPFCSSGVYVNGHGPDVPDAVISINCECVNPRCLANPAMPKAEAERHYAEARQQKEERELRERDHESAMRRIAEDNEARREKWHQIYEKCKAEGFCCACAAKNGKFVRHRAECPRLKHAR